MRNKKKPATQHFGWTIGTDISLYRTVIQQNVKGRAFFFYYHSGYEGLQVDINQYVVAVFKIRLKPESVKENKKLKKSSKKSIK